MSIAVDPQNKDRVIIGGLDLWEFEYGVGVEPISYWAISEFASFYVHADHHEIYLMNQIQAEYILVMMVEFLDLMIMENPLLQ